MQNLHLFHEQLRVMRSKRLSASLGGLIGPISNSFDIFKKPSCQVMPFSLFLRVLSRAAQRAQQAAPLQSGVPDH